MAERAGRTLAEFQGEYRLSRQITHADAPPARFLGQAVWSAKGNGLRYVETGVLSVPGHAPMMSERRYFWAPDLKVYFDDGRFFHQVPAVGGSTSHWCDPDQYTAIYDFGDWPDFQVIWDVKGPAKDYRMISDYTPVT